MAEVFGPQWPTAREAVNTGQVALAAEAAGASDSRQLADEARQTGMAFWRAMETDVARAAGPGTEQEPEAS